MIRILVIMTLIWGLWSCDDEIPYELSQPQAGKQKVLVEEISGVRCPNCPDGTRLLNALNQDFDSSLIVVTYHAGSFSVPYKESKYDFKTDQSVALMEFLGRPIGYPSAAIQRISVQGEDTYQRFPNTWTTTISEVLSKEPSVDLRLTVDTSGSVANLHISALFIKDVNSTVYMTAYLVENGLTDPQADTRAGDEFVIDFVHDHVLREILTPITGQKWSDGYKALDFKEDALLVDFDALTQLENPANADFVVFIHTREGVLQVEKANAIPK